MPEVIYQGDLPAFTGRNVPIKEIASAIGKEYNKDYSNLERQ